VIYILISSIIYLQLSCHSEVYDKMAGHYISIIALSLSRYNSVNRQSYEAKVLIVSIASILPSIFRLCARIRCVYGGGYKCGGIDLPGIYTPGIMIAEESTRKIEKSGLDMSAI